MLLINSDKVNKKLKGKVLTFVIFFNFFCNASNNLDLHWL
jgi:hypothetical protein